MEIEEKYYSRQQIFDVLIKNVTQKQLCDIGQALAELNTNDIKQVVRCKDCKHRPKLYDNNRVRYGETSELCPCVCDDSWYSWMPDDDWFCAYGERRESEEK